MFLRRLLLLGGIGLSVVANAEIVQNSNYTGLKTVVRYSLWGGADEVAEARQFCQAFVKLHPSIALDVSVYPWGQYWAKVQTQMASGLAPDVMAFYSGSFGVWVARGALMPLDDLAHQTGLKLDSYDPVAIENCSWDGKLYALPTDIANWCLVYSKDRLEESGIPQSQWPSSTRSMSWDEFLGLSKKLTLRNPDGTFAQYGMSAGQNWDLTIGGMEGGSYVDRLVNPTKATAANNEPLTEAFIKLFQSQYGDCTTIGSVPLASGAFSVNSDTILVAPKFAMGSAGPWALKQLKDAGVHFGVTPMPHDRTSKPIISVNSLGMYSHTKHPNEAWLLISYLASATVEETVGKALKGVPSLKSARDSLVHNAQGIGGCEAFLHDLEIATPILTTSSTDVVSARDNWLTDVEDDLQNEYDSKLSQLPRQNGRISESDYAAFVVAMNSYVAKKIRSQMPELQRSLNDAFKSNLQTAPGPMVGVALPLLAVLFVAAGLVFYVKTVARARSSDDVTAGQDKKYNRLGYLFISPWLLGFCCFVLGPILAAIGLSFTNWNMVSSPTWVGVQHYLELPTDPKFLIGLKNTFLYALLVIPISLCGGLFTAGLLTAKIKGGDIFKAIIYFPALFTGAETAVLWTNMLNKEHGIFNYILSWVNIQPIDWMDAGHAFYSVVMMNFFWIGGAMIVYYAGMKQIPSALYEAADMDGANLPTKFLKITIPMLSPVILFMVVITTIGAFQVFTPALFFARDSTDIGSPNNALRFYAVNIYDQAFNQLRMGLACSYAIILFLIIFAITVVQLTVAKRFVHSENVA